MRCVQFRPIGRFEFRDNCIEGRFGVGNYRKMRPFVFPMFEGSMSIWTISAWEANVANLPVTIVKPYAHREQQIAFGQPCSPHTSHAYPCPTKGCEQSEPTETLRGGVTRIFKFCDVEQFVRRIRCDDPASDVKNRLFRGKSFSTSVSIAQLTGDAVSSNKMSALNFQVFTI